MREGEDCDLETCFLVEECSDLATFISGGTGGAADIFS